MPIINHIPAPLINSPVDFSWRSASILTPLETTIGEFTVPYGLSTITGFTTPSSKSTPFTITVADASSFVGGGGSNLAGTSFEVPKWQYPIPVGTLYIGTGPTHWALIGYTITSGGAAAISGNTFECCFVIDGYSGGTNQTFTSGTDIYDPRWITLELPLSAFTATNVTFDAMDTLTEGKPSSKGANIVSFHWDLGNGIEAEGPLVETQYWYTGTLNYSDGSLAAPTEVQVTLTAVDIDGNVYHVTHPIVFGELYDSLGAPFTPAYLGD
jgi:hypothetical protein